MKKKLLFTAFVVAFVTAQTASAKIIQLGVKGGVNVASVSFSSPSSNFSASNITGFNIGPMIEFNLPVIGLGLEGAALYSQKGFTLKDANYKTSNIDVPISLKWKFGLPILKVYLMAGPYFSFGVGNSTSIGIAGVSIPTIKSNAASVGANVGAGVELFKRVQVGVSYMYGFSDAYTLGKMNVDQYDLKDRILNISAAVLF